MAATQSRYGLHILLFLFLILLIGCDDKGVILEGLVLDQNNGVASLTTGDGGTCISAPCTIGTFWNDSFITPNSFTVAIKSAALIKQGEMTPSYVIFDSGDIANPKITSFLPGTTQNLGSNPESPADGTYDKIQYVVSYYEMLIPITYPGQGSTPHRVRLYLGTYNDATIGQGVAQNDILIDDPSGALLWIDPNSGLGNFISTRAGSTVLQVPPEQLGEPGFEDGSIDGPPPTDPYTFTVTLPSPLTISGSDSQSVIQLTFDTTGIFFFDSTNRDSSGDSPNNNSNFKPPLAHCTTNGSGLTNTECDGRLDANPKAFFWPGLPAVTATGSGGEGSVTTTTTTISTTTTT